MNNSNTTAKPAPFAAIACGGTGGHLFPGLAVGRELRKLGCDVTLLVSSKEIDRKAAAGAGDMEVVALPGVGLSRGNFLGFARNFWQSYRQSKVYFRRRRPDLVLAMGGFTAAPPILAGRACGARAFLHESNTIPGRANRWLARRVDGAFVYFDQTRDRLRAQTVETIGMPLRPEFLSPMTQEAARAFLGLLPEKPVLLVMGGSQGAHRINELMIAALPHLLRDDFSLQIIHLTGADDVKKVQGAYASWPHPFLVRAFLADMSPALAAADVAVSRAGASSLAELAARQLPAILIPYPTAADNHQYHNARAFADRVAARFFHEANLDPSLLAAEILNLLKNDAQRGAMKCALLSFHNPTAAADVARRILHWSTHAHSAPSLAPNPKAPALEVLNA